MVGVWRIIGEEDQEHPFTRQLEQRARNLIGESHGDGWHDASPPAILERDIRSTVAQIEETRRVHTAERQRLLRLECYTDTELMQMEQRTPRYSPYRYPEREKLQRRLMSIEHDRRQLSLSEIGQLQELHVRLLYRLNEHARLMKRWTSSTSPGN